MKKTVIILIALAFIVCSCGQITKKKGNVSNIENTTSLENENNVSNIENEKKLPDYEGFGNKQNPLYGKIYRNIKDIPELKHWSNESSGGSVIDAGKDENGNYRFCVEYFYDDNRNGMCFFEEIVRYDESGSVKYKILDTLNIGKLNDNEWFVFCNCRQNTIWDSEILAIIIAEDDKQFHERIIKAWRADTKTGRIKPIENLNGIDCANEGYGL